MSDELKNLRNKLTAASEVNSTKRANPLEQKKKRLETSKKISEDDIVNMLDDGMNIEDIAAEFSLSLATIGQYLERGLKKKRIIVDLDLLMESERRSELEQRLLSINTSSIKKIRELLHGEFEEWEIRVIRGVLLSRISNEFE